MKRRLLFMVASAIFVLPLPVRAADALKDALSAIPGDALAFIAVPNFKQLDADYQKAVASLGLEPFVPPPMNSLVAALKQRAPMLEKIDEDGAVIVVFMPAASVQELQMKQAVILSAKDPKALMEAMNGQAGEGGMWTVNLFGMPMYAFPTENRVIVSMMPDLAKSIKESKTAIVDKLDANVVRGFEGLDLILWLDGQKLVKTVRPLVEGMLLPMMAAQAGTGGFEARYAEYNNKNIKMMMDGLSSMTIGVALNDAGLDIRFASTAVPGSELAKRTKLRTTSESLLDGLPAVDYALAFGQVMDPEIMKQASSDLEFLFAAGSGIEGMDQEKLKKLQGGLTDMLSSMHGARGVLELLAPGPDGLLGVALVIQTSDSEKWISTLAEVSDVGKQIVASAAKAHGEDEKEIEEFLSAVSFGKDAETVAGAKTSHLKVDLDKIAKMNEADEEEIEEAKKFFGKEGLLLRVAAADAKSVVLTFGGGEPRMSRFVAAAKDKGAPLAKTPGIEKVSQHLPKERSSIMYVAVDNILDRIKKIQEYMEEEPLPIQMPPINAPVAMAMTGGDGWAQYDIFLATELMVAGKNAAMTMMMGPAAQEPAEAPE